MSTEAEQTAKSSESERSNKVRLPLSISSKEDWIDYYSALDPEYSGKYFSLAQETLLSDMIQSGLSAEAELETATTDEGHEDLYERINDGMLARTALFEVNIPFALYYARESVGISHPSSTEKIRSHKFQKIAGASAGTYAPLSSLKSPFADLESREQSALEALWESTARFVPSESKAKFTTFAAWSIQHKIDRDVRKEEHNGIRLPDARHSEIGSYFRKNPYTDTEPIPENIKELIERSTYMDLAALELNSDTSRIDDTFEEDFAETIADIYGSDGVEGELFEVMNDDLLASFNRVFETLSEREAGVIKMRFGVDLPAPCTLDEIAAAYGVTRTRICQIESKTMAKLRHFSRSQHLAPHLYPRSKDPTDTSAASDEWFVHSQYYGRAGDGSIRGLGRIAANKASAHRFKLPAEKALTIEEYRKNEEKKAWQAFPGESWDEPVRTTHLSEAEPIKAIVDSYQLEQMKNILLNSQSYHYQTSFGEAVNTPAPIALLKRINSLANGEYILRGQVDSLYFDFIAEAVPKLCAELGSDFSVSRAQNLFDTLYKKYVYDDLEDENLDLGPQVLLGELLVQEANRLVPTTSPSK